MAERFTLDDLNAFFRAHARTSGQPAPDSAPTASQMDLVNELKGQG